MASQGLDTSVAVPGTEEIGELGDRYAKITLEKEEDVGLEILE